MESSWEKARKIMPTLMISQKADALERYGYCTSTNKHTISLFRFRSKASGGKGYFGRMGGSQSLSFDWVWALLETLLI